MMDHSDSDIRRDLRDERSGVVQAVRVAHGIGNAHVAGLAPGGTPRIANLEGVGRAVVAHCNDRMVNLTEETARLGEDSGSVRLPRVVSINCDAHGSRVQRGLETSVGLCHGLVPCNGSSGQFLGHGAGLAIPIRGSVRVAALSGNSGRANVRNAVLVETAVATLGSTVGAAVHQLLLSVASQLACCKCICALHSSHSREGPAAAALSLILDRVDN